MSNTITLKNWHLLIALFASAFLSVTANNLISPNVSEVLTCEGALPNEENLIISKVVGLEGLEQVRKNVKITIGPRYNSGDEYDFDITIYNHQEASYFSKKLQGRGFLEGVLEVDKFLIDNPKLYERK